MSVALLVERFGADGAARAITSLSLTGEMPDDEPQGVLTPLPPERDDHARVRGVMGMLGGPV